MKYEEWRKKEIENKIKKEYLKIKKECGCSDGISEANYCHQIMTYSDEYPHHFVLITFFFLLWFFRPFFKAYLF